MLSGSTPKILGVRLRRADQTGVPKTNKTTHLVLHVERKPYGHRPVSGDVFGKDCNTSPAAREEHEDLNHSKLEVGQS